MPSQMLVAAVLAASAVLTAVVLLLKPKSEIPLSRRRPARAAEPGLLTKLTGRITTIVDHVLTRRGSTGLDLSLERAGVKMPAKELVFLTICAMVLALSAGLLFFNPFLAVLLTAAPPVVVKVGLGFLIGRRQKKFGLQLEETTQLLAGQLRAGYSFGQAVNAVANESEAPTSEEFQRISSEVRLGRPIGDAMFACAERMRSDDFKMLGEAVAINREVGGNLAEVIEKAGHTLRLRAELHRRVQSLASEGKMSAYILIALPIGMSAYMAAAKPDYFALFFESIIGMALLGTAVVMLLAGSFWMKSIIKIKY